MTILRVGQNRKAAVTVGKPRATSGVIVIRGNRHRQSAWLVSIRPRDRISIGKISAGCCQSQLRSAKSGILVKKESLPQGQHVSRIRYQAIISPAFAEDVPPIRSRRRPERHRVTDPYSQLLAPRTALLFIHLLTVFNNFLSGLSASAGLAVRRIIDELANRDPELGCSELA